MARGKASVTSLKDISGGVGYPPSLYSLDLWHLLVLYKGQTKIRERHIKTVLQLKAMSKDQASHNEESVNSPGECAYSDAMLQLVRAGYDLLGPSVKRFRRDSSNKQPGMS